MTDPFDSLRHPTTGAEPDARFVDDVLARVADRLDRAPQQGALQPTTAPVDLEVVPMSIAPTPARRPVVWLAAAAVIALVVVGVAALTKDDSTGTPVSSDPTSSTDPGTTVAGTVPELVGSPVPAEIQARWMSSDRTEIAGPAGSSLSLRDGRYALSVSNGNTSPIFNGDAVASGSSTFTVNSRDDLSKCPVDAVGTYRWSLSESGRMLTVTAEADPCERRAGALAGTYFRMGCIDTGDNCLGLLDPGTFMSQFIMPLLPKSGLWQATYGGLTYTVPDGWANYADWPRQFGLTPADAFAATTSDEVDPARGIDVMTTVQPLTAVCGGEPMAVGSLDEAVAAFSGVPGLDVGNVTTLTIDGREARSIDLKIADGASPDCTGDPVIEHFAGGGGLDPSSHWGIAVGDRQRLVLIDVSGGATDVDGGIQLIGVLIWDRQPAGFDAFVAQAMPIVESFHFA